MNMRELIPWGRQTSQAPSQYRGDDSPFLTLHREMNRLFDDVFRGFDSPAFGGRTMAWPTLEVTEDGGIVRVTAEVPGVDQGDIEVLFEEGVLTIRGEKKSETEDKERRFSERYYGRFERRLPLRWAVEEDKIEASFKDGVLTVNLPKSPEAEPRAKRIPLKNAA